ncbi:hypothetical protein HHX47_DHR3000972 [Lentinula edodes]|nr:hypothetical protein HHX47_DHR3000972 [Lentinula edodes]
MAFLETAEKIRGQSMKPGDLRNVFSDCSDIHSAHPSRTSFSSYDTHYFTKFNEHDGLERVLRLEKDSGIQVIPVSPSPVSAEGYQSLNYRGSGTPRPKEHPLNNLQNIPIVDASRVRHYSHIPDAVLTPSTNLVHAPDHNRPEIDAPKFNNHDDTNPPTWMNALNSSSLLSPIVINKQHSYPHSSEKPKTATVSPLTYIHSAKALDSLTLPCIPLTTHIRLCLCGELFSYNLSNLQSDPREIIELLKSTGSERGNWMTVGACYRRQGNPHAAIAVIQSMVEGEEYGCPRHSGFPLIYLPPIVMARYGVSENELKPAFLMLAGCESDLSRLTRNEGRITLEHQQKSQRWLQKVYGAMKSHSDNIGVDAPSNNPKLPARPPSPSGSDEHLRREIQSLRDRLRHQAGLLSDVRSAKRKLEGSYKSERDTRRRIEREIKGMKAERDKTCRR